MTGHQKQYAIISIDKTPSNASASASADAPHTAQDRRAKRFLRRAGSRSPPGKTSLTTAAAQADRNAPPDDR